MIVMGTRMARGSKDNGDMKRETDETKKRRERGGGERRRKRRESKEKQ